MANISDLGGLCGHRDAKIGKKLDSRLPITLPILHQITQAGITICSSQYTTLMLTATCSLAFFAFLRVGEITVSHGPLDHHILLVNHVGRILDSDGQVTALKVTFYDFKHQYNQSPFSITVSRQASLCPVQSMVNYLEVRGSRPGPLFITSDGQSVRRSVFSNLLTQCVKACSLNSDRYKGHSFRIGGATHAYIRIHSLPSV